ncbi:carotenoid 9,10(9',10')-cleavage dioxygenase 1-like [Punica granatum]|uniref:Carotenoid 9,10(9',10')-cleavage dioxygenase 1-like n=1 Tax=Punica granatum TaxID=22663 RepID=A0A6P8DRF2_PUNGR|nr:carotenoid 9,10(9',10')-cleavage dioxygenase 1-like [Punica granatum]
MRVGPNAKFPLVAGYHCFDGDGMIHGRRITNGIASCCSDFGKWALANYDKSLINSFTAHPKIDPFTGAIRHVPSYVQRWVHAQTSADHDTRAHHDVQLCHH